MKKPKLNLEESEALLDLFDHEGFAVLVKVINEFVSEQEMKLAKISIEKDVQQLVHAKLKAEGSRKLASDLAELKEVLFREKG